MNFDKLTMIGAAQDDKGLEKAKDWLAAVKQYKLRIKADVHRGNTYSFTSLMKHLDEELREFRKAVRQEKDAVTVLMELADVSNMIDMIVSTIIANEDKEEHND